MGQDQISLNELRNFSGNTAEFQGKRLSYTQEEANHIGIGTYGKAGFLIERFSYGNFIYLFLLDSSDKTIIDAIIKEKICPFHFFGDSELSLDGGEFEDYLVEFTADESGNELTYLTIYGIDKAEEKIITIDYTELIEMPPLEQ